MQQLVSCLIQLYMRHPSGDWTGTIDVSWDAVLSSAVISGCVPNRWTSTAHTSISFRPHAFRDGKCQMTWATEEIRVVGNQFTPYLQTNPHWFWSSLTTPKSPRGMKKKSNRKAQPELPFFAPRPLYCKRDICSFRQRYMPSSSVKDRSVFPGFPKMFRHFLDSWNSTAKFRNSMAKWLNHAKSTRIIEKSSFMKYPPQISQICQIPSQAPSSPEWDRSGSASRCRSSGAPESARERRSAAPRAPGRAPTWPGSGAQSSVSYGDVWVWNGMVLTYIYYI